MLDQSLRIKNTLDSLWIWILLASILLTTVLLAYQADASIKQRYQEKLEARQDEIIEELKNASRIYEHLYLGAKGLFDASNYVDRDEWKSYVSALNVEEDYKGIQLFGYAQYLTPETLPAFIEQQKEEGLEGFHIRPSGVRQSHAVEKYIEPEKPYTKKRIGFDIWFDDRRRDALEYARDTGKTAISSRISADNEPHLDADITGFYIYVPHYDKSLPAQTPKQRQNAISGFIFGFFDLGQMIQGFKGREAPDIALEIFQGSSTSPENLIYKSNPVERKKKALEFNPITTTSNIPFYNTQWTIRFTTLPGFGKNIDRTYPILIILSGLGLCIVSFIAFWSMRKGKHYAELIASERSDDLRNAAAFQDLILENIPALIFVKDSEFRIVSANPAFMAAYPEDMRGDIIGKTTVEQYDKKEADEFLKHDRKALENGFSETEETITFPTGERRTLSTKKIRFKDNKGERFILGVAHDITEIKEATSALKQSEEDFRSAIEHSPIGMALVSTKGKWLRVNKALCDILGYEEKEFLKTDFQTITHPEDLETDMDLVKQVMDDEIQTYQMEKRYFHKNGQIVWALLCVALVREENGDPKYFISQIQDITERKNAEEEIMRSNEELERFAYIASHDLQEPLRMVRNFTGLLDAEYSETMDETAGQYMNFITDAAERMQNLIADLLEYSRVGAENAGFETFDTNKTLKIVKENLADEIKETGTTITVEDLPEIYANPVRFSRLLQNLIGNGIKYRKPDTKPEINITCQEGKNHYEFSVTDNGIGIKEEYLDQIFVIFKRLHNKDEYSGTGIGLAVCKKIVESFRGQLWVESKFGKGTTFKFTVPKTTLNEDEAKS